MPMYADDQDACPEKFVTLRVTELDALHERIEELEAERDARPVVRWERIAPEREKCMIGPVRVGNIEVHDVAWKATLRLAFHHVLVVGEDFPTPEAAKAAVEEALRGLSAKTEG